MITFERPHSDARDVTPAIYLYGTSMCFSWWLLYVGFIWKEDYLYEYRKGKFSIVLEAIFRHFALIPVINYSPDEGPFMDISLFWMWFGLTFRKYQ